MRIVKRLPSVVLVALLMLCITPAYAGVCPHCNNEQTVQMGNGYFCFACSRLIVGNAVTKQDTPRNMLQVGSDTDPSATPVPSPSPLASDHREPSDSLQAVGENMLAKTPIVSRSVKSQLQHCYGQGEGEHQAIKGSMQEMMSHHLANDVLKKSLQKEDKVDMSVEKSMVTALDQEVTRFFHKALANNLVSVDSNGSVKENVPVGEQPSYMRSESDQCPLWEESELSTMPLMSNYVQVRQADIWGSLFHDTVIVFVWDDQKPTRVRFVLAALSYRNGRYYQYLPAIRGTEAKLLQYKEQYQLLQVIKGIEENKKVSPTVGVTYYHSAS